MASKLLVTPEEVMAKAEAITAQKTVMEDLMKNFQTKVDTLVQEAWIGEAGSAYQQQFQFLLQEIRDALTRIETHATNLKDAAREYSEMEDSLKGKASTLDTSNIF